MRRSVAVFVASASLLARPAYADPATLLPHIAGPDRAPSTTAVATMTVFNKTPFFFAGKGAALERTVKVTVPKVAWRRAVLEFTDTPSADEPWDRVFAFSISGVEVLRGTTPRADMTVRKDITEYASLLRPGTKVPFTTSIGTYVGSHRVTARIAFYNEAPQAPAYKQVVPAFKTVGIEPQHEERARHSAKGVARFAKTKPNAAVVELTTSGHLPEGEFWYLPPDGSITPPVLHLRLDGVEVATARAMPYVYALLGFEGANQSLHPPMWWTAQQVLDQAGVHTGVGEIPSYRATLPTDVVAKLAGTRKVEVAVDGKGLWITSVAFLLS